MTSWGFSWKSEIKERRRVTEYTKKVVNKIIAGRRIMPGSTGCISSSQKSHCATAAVRSQINFEIARLMRGA
jgi:hypothetical protein